MANGNGQLRVDPTSSNIVGEVNQDSRLLPEFTFHHGRVKQVINTEEDLAISAYSISELPSDLSQCILIIPRCRANFVRMQSKFALMHSKFA